jgi:hypothetical protein
MGGVNFRTGMVVAGARGSAGGAAKTAQAAIFRSAMFTSRLGTSSFGGEARTGASAGGAVRPGATKRRGSGFGLYPAIHAERDRKLQEARKQRQIRRQQAA